MGQLGDNLAQIELEQRDESEEITREVLLEGFYHETRPSDEFPYLLHVYGFLSHVDLGEEVLGKLNEGDEESCFPLSVAYGFKKEQAVKWLQDVGNLYGIKLTKKEIIEAGGIENDRKGSINFYNNEPVWGITNA